MPSDFIASRTASYEIVKAQKETIRVYELLVDEMRKNTQTIEGRIEKALASVKEYEDQIKPMTGAMLIMMGSIPTDSATRHLREMLAEVEGR